MPRGRPRKADINDVVLYQPNGDIPVRYGVIVDYRDDVKWGRYRIVPSDALGRQHHGRATWIDSVDLDPVGRRGHTAAVAYRNNIRLGGDEVRGCTCQCCPHVKGVEGEPKE